MSVNEGVTLNSVRWLEVHPWLNIVRSFRIAVSLRVLLLGALGFLLTLLGWWCIAGMFPKDSQAAAAWQRLGGDTSPWAVIDHAVPNQPFLPGVPVSAGNDAAGGPSVAAWHPQGAFFGSWAQLTRPVWEIFTQPTMTMSSLLCLILSALWGLAVWAFFGGAITRIAAVQLASDEQVGWGAALRWGGTKWLAYFGAPLFPLMGILLAAIPLLILGLLLRFGLGLLLVGLAWPVALLGGLVMALLLLGLVFGWPLMWATISSEGTDGFDALSRTYAYVFQRPLRYLFYALVAALIGWLGWLVVENFAAGVVWLSLWAASWGSGAVRWQEIASGMTAGGEPLSGMGYAGACLIGFWSGCVKWLAAGYLYGYFWTAATAIYFLLRRDVDATELDEVFLEADRSEQDYALPPLATDQAGARR